MTDRPAGSIEQLIELLVDLEQTISPKLRVYPLRPIKIDPPCIYNWIQPSSSDIPAIATVRDQLELSVRIILPRSDLDEQTAAMVRYWDLARDTIDADLVVPMNSVLSPVCVMAKRTRMRNIVDTFNQIEYLGLELQLQMEIHRRFA